MAIWPVLNKQLYLATAFLDTPTGSVAGGACDFSEARAASRARSEAVERGSLIVNGPRLVLSREEALRRGLRLLAPTEELGQAREWVPGRSAVPGEGVAVPADVALLGRYSGGRGWFKQSSVGTAAHHDRRVAETAGVLECLERHALRRVWAGAATLRPMSGRLGETLSTELMAALDENKLLVHAWNINGLRPVHVSLVLICRKDCQQVTFGAGASFDVDTALTHALCEGISVRAALSNSSSGSDPRFRQAALSARHQAAFISFLKDLETDDSAPEMPLDDISSLVERCFGVPPVLVDVPSLGDQKVVKSVIPRVDFLIPRTASRYILTPGYLE